MNTKTQRPLVNLKFAWLAGLLALLVFLAVAAARPASGEFLARSADKGMQSRFQDIFFGHHKRGRATIVADFDLDGRPDVYLGNPGDESFVLRNVPGPGGRGSRFELAQNLLVGPLAWGGVAFDYDNDGDYDLFISGGGNEDLDWSYLFRNMWIEQGVLTFVDVTAEAGVAGLIPDGGTEPEMAASANALAADYDRDGDSDLFVNINKSADLVDSRNILWRNNGNGTFTDVTLSVGMDNAASTRHSTFLDVDNDGDLDLYENNFQNTNILWRNLLVESGQAVFEDATQEFSALDPIDYPYHSFDSASADFNNDGWEDLLVFMRGAVAHPNDPYPPGHALFINQAGAGFINVADSSELNNPYQAELGVMGCQLGDLNGDGVADVFIGNGAPEGGEVDQLFLSNSIPGALPHFVNTSEMIDYPAKRVGGLSYPPYPYRTHGTAIADFDGNGTTELAVSNGGPSGSPDIVREPNRLFDFDSLFSYNYLSVRPIGNGIEVSMDAVNTRFALTVSEGGGEPWTLHRTLFAGSCFSAQNGFDVHFGLGNADTIHELQITWPDGTMETITEGLSINSEIVVNR